MSAKDLEAKRPEADVRYRELVENIAHGCYWLIEDAKRLAGEYGFPLGPLETATKRLETEIREGRIIPLGSS